MFRSDQLKTSLLMVALLFPVVGFSDHRRPPPPPPWYLVAQNQNAQKQTLSKSQAINIAKRRHQGRVLSAELVGAKQRHFYKIKMLTKDGRVKTVQVNAQKKN